MRRIFFEVKCFRKLNEPMFSFLTITLVRQMEKISASFILQARLTRQKMYARTSEGLNTRPS